ncbi:hypothetical protein P9B03_07045 [Metasolibacillus meyeri]|uniref:Uncharacterized protein n=1 Tax=Metasolibacillus meyeri TaxID=1071052 RepID=A0AAW9NNY8_9BACL|nr:hypothetical protein [Metasolibacillus meyeri]MEC1178236.1 hypothetical protein [Metasolibacillus meyeri]
MKITNFSQIQSNPVNTTNQTNKKKDNQTHLTEAYIPTTKSTQSDDLLWNYTPHEVGKPATIKTASMGLNNLAQPDWDVIPTKWKQVPPQDELIAQIKETVTRNILDGKSTPTRQVSIFLAQYISPVSPDREALHQQAMKAIKKFEAEEKATPLGELSLVTYLNNMDFGIEKNIAMSADGAIKPAMNSLGGYDYEVVVGGQTLLTSTNGHWDYVMTPAEQQKRDEFYKIYWSFVDQARNELKNLSNQQE